MSELRKVWSDRALHRGFDSDLDRASPWILFICLLGIPAAGSVALVLAVQIPRFVYGQANPFLFVPEIGSLICVAFLLIVLRVCLALPTAPRGLYRDVLDFLAMARWHPAVKTALAGLVIVPPAFYLHGQPGFIPALRILGWRSLASGDVQSTLDGVAAVYQLALTGGVPLLFVLHMVSRWKPGSRLLPWVLLPFLFVGTAMGVVLIVATIH